MTIVESGVLAGIPAGAVIGGMLCKGHGFFAVMGGSLAGTVLGAAAGWAYAFILILLLSFVGVLWRAARKRRDTSPTSADIKRMTPVGIAGTFTATIIALACWFSLGWSLALAATLAIALGTAVIAVARCEMR